MKGQTRDPNTFRVEPYADVFWSAAANRVYRFGAASAAVARAICRRRRGAAGRV